MFKHMIETADRAGLIRLWHWILAGVLLVGYSLYLWSGPVNFEEDGDENRYRAAVVAVTILAGLIYFSVFIHFKHTGQSRLIIIWIFLIAVVMRCILLFSVSPLANDYYRYLWDGAVTANGLNPYSYSPQTIQKGWAGKDALENEKIRQLTSESGDLLDRINHPHLRTIYPPAAQGVFALAYQIAPFESAGLRVVYMMFEGLGLIFLLVLMRRSGLPITAAAAWMWNPLVLYEMYYKNHYDLLVGVFLLIFIWAMSKRRWVAGAVSLAVSVGLKLWPALMFAFLIFPLGKAKLKRAGVLVIFGCLMVVIVFLYADAIGNKEDSGLRAYSKSWEDHGWAYAGFDWAGGKMAQLSGDRLDGDLIGRGLVVLILFTITTLLAAKCGGNSKILCYHLAMVILLMLLLSPTVYPWYYTAMVPLLVLARKGIFLIWTLLLPLCYLGENVMDYKTLVWLIHLPVWVLLIVELIRTKGLTRNKARVKNV